ncbi:MAG: hypothetical protein Tsb0010_05080 [Parvularculaceae bacterium]
MAIIFAIHGTKSTNDAAISYDWWKQNGALQEKLATCIEGEIRFIPFSWNGKNSQRERSKEAARLRDDIKAEIKRGRKDEPVILIAHSHGGNVAMIACLDDPELEAVRVITVGAPFFTFSDGAIRQFLEFIFVYAILIGTFGFVFVQGANILDIVAVSQIPGLGWIHSMVGNWFAESSLSITPEQAIAGILSVLAVIGVTLIYRRLRLRQRFDGYVKKFLPRSSFARRNLLTLYHRDDEAINFLGFDIRDPSSSQSKRNPQIKRIARSIASIVSIPLVGAILLVYVSFLWSTYIAGLLMRTNQNNLIMDIGSVITGFGVIASIVILGIAGMWAAKKLVSYLVAGALQFYQENLIYGRDKYLRRVSVVGSWPAYLDMSGRWEPIAGAIADSILSAAKKDAPQTIDEIRLFLRRSTSEQAIDTLSGILENTSGKGLVHNAYFQSDLFMTMLSYAVISLAEPDLSPTEAFLHDEENGFNAGKRAIDQFAPIRWHSDNPSSAFNRQRTDRRLQLFKLPRITAPIG